jgi:hypothetical protein
LFSSPSPPSPCCLLFFFPLQVWRANWPQYVGVGRLKRGVRDKETDKEGRGLVKMRLLRSIALVEIPDTQTSVSVHSRHAYMSFRVCVWGGGAVMCECVES